MRNWREKEFEQHLTPAAMRSGIRFWAYAARHPKLYRWGARLAARVLGNLGRGKGRIASLPLASGWTRFRDCRRRRAALSSISGRIGRTGRGRGTTSLLPSWEKAATTQSGRTDEGAYQFGVLSRGGVTPSPASDLRSSSPSPTWGDGKNFVRSTSLSQCRCVGRGRMSLFSSAKAMEVHMEIRRSGSEPSTQGPADWFTGAVRIDRLFDLPEPARAAAALVTFEPGARTNWHTHPFGQTVIVTAGLGWAQREGGPVEEIRPGDVVWFEPGERHWHGASANERDESYRHPGKTKWQSGHLAGEGHRRAVRRQ